MNRLMKFGIGIYLITLYAVIVIPLAWKYYDGTGWGRVWVGQANFFHGMITNALVFWMLSPRKQLRNDNAQ